MAKLAQTSVKYLIRIEFNAEGTVEKPDIIGALFGQTEGLLGNDLDLRELQRTGRIGRIDVTVKNIKGKSTGEVLIPSSLSNTETALIAATLETIERIGPCDAKLTVKLIEDIRSVKRKTIKSRAQSLLMQMSRNTPELASITEEINDAVKVDAITDYKGLPAGSETAVSDKIILCEGRADVIALLKCGIKNGLAVGGTNIPSNIKEVTAQKEVTLFLDGDRGGDLIMKALMSVVTVSFVARAPEGKEVEELTKKEIYQCIRNRVPVKDAKFISQISRRSDTAVAGKEDTRQDTTRKTAVSTPSQRSAIRRSPPVSSRSGSSVRSSTSRVGTPVGRDTRRTGGFSSSRPSFADRNTASHDAKKEEIGKEKLELYKKHLEELVGTRAVSIYDKNDNFAGRVPVKEIAKAIVQVSNPKTVVMDGKVDSKLCEVVEKSGVSLVISMDKESGIYTKITVLTEKDL